MDAKARTQRARKAAYARWAKHDPKEDLEDVRAGFRLRLRLQVIHEARAHGVSLTWEEIARRAESLRRSHMAGMTLRRWPKD